MIHFIHFNSWNNNNEYTHLKYRLKSRLYSTSNYNLVTCSTDQDTALQVKQVPRGQGSEVRGRPSQRSEMNPLQRDVEKNSTEGRSGWFNGNGPIRVLCGGRGGATATWLKSFKPHPISPSTAAASTQLPVDRRCRQRAPSASTVSERR